MYKGPSHKSGRNLYLLGKENTGRTDFNIMRTAEWEVTCPWHQHLESRCRKIMSSRPTLGGIKLIQWVETSLVQKNLSRRSHLLKTCVCICMCAGMCVYVCLVSVCLSMCLSVWGVFMCLSLCICSKSIVAKKALILPFLVYEIYTL